MTELREKFEKLMTAIGHSVDRLSAHGPHHDEYEDEWVRFAWDVYRDGHAEGVKKTAQRCAAICHDEALESHIAWKLIRAEYPEVF